jgi:hypothetical protein
LYILKAAGKHHFRPHRKEGRKGGSKRQWKNERKRKQNRLVIGVNGIYIFNDGNGKWIGEETQHAVRTHAPCATVTELNDWWEESSHLKTTILASGRRRKRGRSAHGSRNMKHSAFRWLRRYEWNALYLVCFGSCSNHGIWKWHAARTEVRIHTKL